MHELGNTRSAHRPDHLLQTPDTFVRAPLSGMRNATAIIHIAPAAGARFTQITAEFDAEGFLPATPVQRFVYVLDGELQIAGHTLAPGSYAYVPAGSETSLSATRTARAAVIEKEYLAIPGTAAPPFCTGQESDVKAESLTEGDTSIEVRHLLPDEPAFDFAVNTMTYQPGAALPMVETHVMEHGLLMLSGGGIYRLNDRWYPVTRGDFIWMAPYCPQWFGALGRTPARYLIYKDWNR
jgi:(S)-ureidoglycine aminohydrolase